MVKRCRCPASSGMALVAICRNREMIGRYGVAGFTARIYIAGLVAGMTFIATQVSVHAEKLEIVMSIVA